MGITFSEGPRRSTIETVPAVVGCEQVSFGKILCDKDLLRY